MQRPPPAGDDVVLPNSSTTPSSPASPLLSSSSSPSSSISEHSSLQTSSTYPSAAATAATGSTSANSIQAGKGLPLSHFLSQSQSHFHSHSQSGPVQSGGAANTMVADSTAVILPSTHHLHQRYLHHYQHHHYHYQQSDLQRHAKAASEFLSSPELSTSATPISQLLPHPSHAVERERPRSNASKSAFSTFAIPNSATMTTSNSVSSASLPISMGLSSVIQKKIPNSALNNASIGASVSNGVTPGMTSSPAVPITNPINDNNSTATHHSLLPIAETAVRSHRSDATAMAMSTASSSAHHHPIDQPNLDVSSRNSNHATLSQILGLQPLIRQQQHPQHLVHHQQTSDRPPVFLTEEARGRIREWSIAVSEASLNSEIEESRSSLNENEEMMDVNDEEPAAMGSTGGTHSISADGNKSDDLVAQSHHSSLSDIGQKRIPDIVASTPASAQKPVVEKRTPSLSEMMAPIAATATAATAPTDVTDTSAPMSVPPPILTSSSVRSVSPVKIISTDHKNMACLYSSGNSSVESLNGSYSTAVSEAQRFGPHAFHAGAQPNRGLERHTPLEESTSRFSIANLCNSNGTGHELVYIDSNGNSSNTSNVAEFKIFGKTKGKCIASENECDAGLDEKNGAFDRQHQPSYHHHDEPDHYRSQGRSQMHPESSSSKASERHDTYSKTRPGMQNMVNNANAHLISNNSPQPCSMTSSSSPSPTQPFLPSSSSAFSHFISSKLSVSKNHERDHAASQSSGSRSTNFLSSSSTSSIPPSLSASASVRQSLAPYPLAAVRTSSLRPFASARGSNNSVHHMSAKATPVDSESPFSSTSSSLQWPSSLSSLHSASSLPSSSSSPRYQERLMNYRKEVSKNLIDILMTLSPSASNQSTAAAATAAVLAAMAQVKHSSLPSSLSSLLLTSSTSTSSSSSSCSSSSSMLQSSSSGSSSSVSSSMSELSSSLSAARLRFGDDSIASVASHRLRAGLTPNADLSFLSNLRPTSPEIIAQLQDQQEAMLGLELDDADAPSQIDSNVEMMVIDDGDLDAQQVAFDLEVPLPESLRALLEDKPRASSR